MAQSAKAISSPIPVEWYPTLAFFMLTIGLVVTAFFFIYEATVSRRNRSLQNELVTASVASFFLTSIRIEFADTRMSFKKVKFSPHILSDNIMVDQSLVRSLFETWLLVLDLYSCYWLLEFMSDAELNVVYDANNTL